MKWYVVVCASVVMLILTVNPSLAAEAPNLPLIELQEAVSSLYSYSLKIVGLAVFVMYLIAGLGFILPAGVKPAWMGKPVDIIKDATIGLILLFSAYLILNTINPDLVGGGGAQNGTTFVATPTPSPEPQRTPLPFSATIIFPPEAGDANHNGVYILDGILNNDDLRELIVSIDGVVYGRVPAGRSLTMASLPPGEVSYSH